jgi:hypothetical protein
VAGTYLFLIHFFNQKQKLFLRAIAGCFLMIQFLLVISFLSDYFTKYDQDSADAYIYGYQQVFDYILPLENSVDHIIFTSEYGQPYIYALFFRKTDPIAYHGGSLVKYLFPDKINVGDLQRENSLIIATPREINPALADSLVVAPNGEVRFVIVRTKKHDEAQ